MEEDDHPPLTKTAIDWKSLYIQNLSPQNLDFIPDVISWERLYKVTERLKKDLIGDKESFTTTGLREYMDEVLDNCIDPQSGVSYYLKALYEKWFPDNQKWKSGWRSRKNPQEKQLENYRKGTEKGYPRAEKAYYGALFYRSLWDAPWPERFKTINEAAEKGNPEAKYWLAKAIASGKFIFEQEPSKWDEERNRIRNEKSFEELTKRAETDIEARRWHYATIYQGRLRQYDTSDETRLQILLEGEKSGDPLARSLVSRTIYYKEFGQKFSSDTEWLATLLAREGEISSSQISPSFGFANYVNRSLLHGFDVWKEMSDFRGYIETLKEREGKGDLDASHCISKGIYDNERFIRLFPIFKDPTPQEGYVELVKRAKKGSWSARDYVCRAHGKGNFGQKKDPAFAEALFKSFVLFDLLIGAPQDEHNRYEFDRWDAHKRDIAEIN